MPPRHRQRRLDVVAAGPGEAGAGEDHTPVAAADPQLLEFVGGVVDPAGDEEARAFGDGDAFDGVARHRPVGLCRSAENPFQHREIGRCHVVARPHFGERRAGGGPQFGNGQPEWFKLGRRRASVGANQRDREPGLLHEIFAEPQRREEAAEVAGLAVERLIGLVRPAPADLRRRDRLGAARARQFDALEHGGAIVDPAVNEGRARLRCQDPVDLEPGWFRREFSPLLCLSSDLYSIL